MWYDQHKTVELDELDLTSAESKATYKQIQNYVLEKLRFKVSTRYIAQVKKKQCPIQKEVTVFRCVEAF